jgi:hypothetical protein
MVIDELEDGHLRAASQQPLGRVDLPAPVRLRDNDPGPGKDPGQARTRGRLDPLAAELRGHAERSVVIAGLL